MALPEYFICCDWGTTNFRLNVVRTGSLDLMYNFESRQGIKHLYNQYVYTNHNNQFEFFKSFLLDQIHQLPAEFQKLDIIIGGMASANIGMKELPYAIFPFSKRGENLYWEEIEIDQEHKAILVSGVRGQHSVMRGEEIQALGAMELCPEIKSSTLILPGTHSKHIQFASGEFTGMKNYMTGEMFDILMEHSILSNSVEQTSWDKKFESTFVEGVLNGIQDLTARLVAVRTRYLLDHLDKKENYYLLSGMLIGDELSYLENTMDKVIIAAPEPLCSLYMRGLSMIIPEEKILQLSAESFAKATLLGHRKILKLQYEK